MRVRLAPRRALQCITWLETGTTAFIYPIWVPRCPSPASFGACFMVGLWFRASAPWQGVTIQLTRTDPNYIQWNNNLCPLSCFVHHIYSYLVKFTYAIHFIVAWFAAPLTCPWILDLYTTNIGISLACLKISLFLTFLESTIFMLGWPVEITYEKIPFPGWKCKPPKTWGIPCFPLIGCPWPNVCVNPPFEKGP